MLKSYQAFLNGKKYIAEITSRTEGEGVSLDVFALDWKGTRIREFTKPFKNEFAAVRGLKAHYPAAKWQEIK
ncbi:MAG: hypothetical protein IJ523_08010 [Succinivibrionaceae bacterium]|nr:hypothetical protein [Succinivibrionaceae bacterium]